MTTKKPVATAREKTEKNFEELPPKACKRRRLATTHHPQTPAGGVVDAKAAVEGGETADGVPPPPAAAAGVVATVSAPMTMYHVPGGGTGVGIAPLNTAALSGSQRIGIIGLPVIVLSDICVCV